MDLPYHAPFGHFSSARIVHKATHTNQKMNLSPTVHAPDSESISPTNLCTCTSTFHSYKQATNKNNTSFNNFVVTRNILKAGICRLPSFPRGKRRFCTQLKIERLDSPRPAGTAVDWQQWDQMRATALLVKVEWICSFFLCNEQLPFLTCPKILKPTRGGGVCSQNFESGWDWAASNSDLSQNFYRGALSKTARLKNKAGLWKIGSQTNRLHHFSEVCWSPGNLSQSLSNKKRTLARTIFLKIFSTKDEQGIISDQWWIKHFDTRLPRETFETHKTPTTVTAKSVLWLTGAPFSVCLPWTANQFQYVLLV